ncbi:MAG: hypothetical protein JWP26_2716 [Devosia sp.]|uniref:hypothetical protein n=1 Tax=Devosia sp. TaxID=1871048 RepID=UPI002635811A|nr:hypothetical protein [Devosia sp.]MDB5587746.1 hypothetical protein [Devosia sp.]
MADIDDGIAVVRSKARVASHVQRAQLMVLVAGLTAFGIVAVAGAMMMTLL